MASSNTIRFSGMNSGLDTENIIKGMMESYQTKIDNQQKKLTTLTWQQEAYRDVIDKLTAFKNKYFNILNRDNYLMSPSKFNQFTSTVSNVTSGKEGMGLKVTTTSSSLGGDYKVRVDQLATAAKAEGTSLKSEAFSLDLDKAADYSTYTTEAEGGQLVRKYNFELDVRVGSVTKTVSVSVDAAETNGKIDMDQFRQDTLDALNKSLQEDFGYSGKSGAGVTGQTDAAGNEWYIQGKLNDKGNIEFDVGGNATAYVTEKSGNFGLAQPSDKTAVAMQSVVDGRNTVSVTVNGVTENVSFNALTSSMFDSKDEAGNETIKQIYDRYKLAAYKKEHKLPSNAEVSNEQLEKFTYTTTQAAKDYNAEQLEWQLNRTFRQQNITFDIDDSYLTAKGSDGKAVDFSVTAVEGGTLGLSKGSAANKFSGTTRLAAMGIAENGEEGGYTFNINGKEVFVEHGGTINDLISAVKKSGAGVTLTFSNLSNKFELTANDMGNGGKINIEGNDITKALGLTDDSGNTIGFTAGQNAIINVNGEEIYHNSNDFTVDGTTFSFDENVSIGELYNVGIEKSYDNVKESIKEFVKDYNQLIDDVYGHIGTAPKKDSKDNKYEPLTDTEKEEMTTEQIEKWEEAAKAGVIYNDSTISGVMSQIRTALYGGIKLDDGTNFGLYTMGIKTSEDFTAHGKLEIDEDKFDAAFEKNAEAIEKLFTDNENGILKKVNTVFDNAVRTTSTNPGSLVRKAGLATGLTATKNTMYTQMQSITKRIQQLQEKYDSKEEYWWKVFTNLESAMSDLNSQSSYMASYLGGMSGQ